MYMIDSMIEMGLKEGQKWPTPAHRKVACALALCNPMVHTRDQLNDIVQKVIKIPKKDIKKIGFYDLPKYGIGLHAFG
jgi:hypothetical protein